MSNSSQPLRPSSYRPLVFLEWTLLSTVGLAAGMLLTLLGIWLASRLGDFLDGDRVVQYLLLPAMGLMLGTFEWLLLRRILARAGLWIWMTLLGWVLGFPLGFALDQWLGNLLGKTLSLDLAGTVQVSTFALLTGALQWLVLRRDLHFAGWWLLASLAGWNAAFALGGPGNMLLGIQLYLVGILYGLTSGIVLLFILRANRPFEKAS